MGTLRATGGILLLTAWIYLPLAIVSAIQINLFLLFVTIQVAIAYLGRFSYVVNLGSICFMSVQLINVLTTHNTIYAEQIIGLLDDPVAAISIAQGEVDRSTYLASFLYLITALVILGFTKPIKLRTSSVVYFVICALSITITFLSPVFVTLKHPTIYIYQILSGKYDTTQFINTGEILPINIIKNDEALRIILIIGEAQGVISKHTRRTVMKNLHQLEEKGKLVNFTNLSQVGAFTIIATKQLLEASSLENIDKPHHNILDIAPALNKPSTYISSRNSNWANLKNIYTRNNTPHFDCKSIDPKCGLLSGVDDLTVLKTLIKPTLKTKSFFNIWQMNGSHSPLDDKSPQSHKTHNDEYLNSLSYTDHVIAELIKELPNHNDKHNNDNPLVLSFIYHETFDFNKLAKLKNTPFTQLDMIKTIFELQGVSANNIDATYNMFNDQVPITRLRVAYASHDKNNKTIIQPDPTIGKR
jgi:hypothetical protein